MTKTNLAALAKEGYRFVSRLPGTFGEPDEVRDLAFDGSAGVRNSSGVDLASGGGCGQFGGGGRQGR